VRRGFPGWLVVLALAGCCRAGGEAPTDLEAEAAALDLSTLAETAGIDQEVLALALTARDCAREQGELKRSRADLLTVIDFSLASTERRLWVLDLDTEEVLFHELVAHGKNTGGNRAKEFSDEPGSLQSSLGVFRTARIYDGKHGTSLKLDGLEPGINGNARDRAIVMHGASYVSDAFIAANGRLGRSWGCPALSEEVAADVIEAIAGGTLLVTYYPDETWLAESTFLHCDDD